MENQSRFVTCSVSDCDRAAICKDLCDMHYKRLRKTGTTDNLREKEYGYKRSHPMYMRWYKLNLRNLLCDEWKDFWQFLNDIGGQVPDNARKLRRLNDKELYGPKNFEWAKTPTEEDKKQYQANYRKENARSIKDGIFKRKYGISIEEYDKLYEYQNGVCAICKQPEKVRHRIAKGDIREMCIDHDHITGKARGLLCGECNRGLGNFRDTEEFLLEAIAYLQKYKE